MVTDRRISSSVSVETRTSSSKTAWVDNPDNQLTWTENKISDGKKLDGIRSTGGHYNKKIDVANNSAAVAADHEPPSELPGVSPSPDGDPSQAVPPQQRYSIFSRSEKWLIVFGAALSAFFSPLTAQIYFPGLNELARDFDVSSAQINLTITTYMIFQGITPMFIGGLADTAGRRPAYVTCFVVYIAANIGLGLCQNYGGLLALRCLQSAGSASTVALCQAVVADIATSNERGQYVGITSLPMVLAPSLGPVIGGVLTKYRGWRSIFWFLSIIAAVALVLVLLFFPETCRRLVGDGSIRPHPAYKTALQMIKDRRRRRRNQKAGCGQDEGALGRSGRPASSSSRPPKLVLRMNNPLDSVSLLMEPALGILLAYGAIVMAGFYAIATGMPTEFGRLYGFNSVQVGLMYLPMSGGSVVAALIVSPAINCNYRRHARRLGIPPARGRQDDLSTFPIERARLEVGLPLLAVAAAVCFAWGWALQRGVPVAVPCVLLFLMGVGIAGFSNSLNVLVIDMNLGRAGAATAANNLARCLLGAAATAAISPMISAMGPGWTYTIFGFLWVAGAPWMLLLARNGIEWRRRTREKTERRRQSLMTTN